MNYEAYVELDMKLEPKIQKIRTECIERFRLRSDITTCDLEHKVFKYRYYPDDYPDLPSPIVSKEDKERFSCYYHLLSSKCTIESVVKSCARSNKQMYDSDVAEFHDERIIITDPCYVRIKDSHDLPEYRIDRCVWKFSVFGDGGFNIFDDRTGEFIGSFTVDGGTMMVAPYDEVLKYNPDFAPSNTWSYFILDHFTGTVQFQVECAEEDYWIADDLVVGKGSINFSSRKPKTR